MELDGLLFFASCLSPEEIMFSLVDIPAKLHDSTSLHLKNLSEKLAQLTLELPNHAQLIDSLPRVFCCSEFVALTCIRHPQFLLDLVQTGDLFNANVRTHYPAQLAQLNINNDAELMTALRLFRNKEMIRIAWRDLADWSTLDETLADLTALAECCIQFTLDYLYEQACARRGTPVLADGTAQNMVILGMGKLGAWELNYSSDIDLIFAYQQDGVLNDRKATSYGEFFSRLCRQLVKILDEVTADGFVFRTDIRLRPFGDSGPVIMTFDGLENYYQTQAREWERYAMVKVRPVAGDAQGSEQFIAMIRPFVYRRYLDYGAFEELRHLKQQITQELQRKDRMDNVKLGPGGIREIEFIGQAFQLIHGGKDIALQDRRIQVILSLLGEKNLLAVEEAQQLLASYQFLRRVENHIQEFQNKQAHDLPKTEHEQQILAFSMGYKNWSLFKEKLDQMRGQVDAIFTHVFSMSAEVDKPSISACIWMGTSDEETCLNQLSALGYLNPEQIIEVLQSFRKTSAIKRLTTKGANNLDKLIPKIIDLLAKEPQALTTLTRLCTLFENLAGRNVYLSLLAENEQALQQLITLTSASSWISEYLSKYPALFDELLDTRSLYDPLEKMALQKQLDQQLENIDTSDIEQLMIGLRRFKHINVLRVAAADIMGIAPLMIVSDYLSYIAEVILEQAVKTAWNIITEKHGYLPNTDVIHSGFGIVGFGKLGGIELSYSSDLDLMFISDYPDAQAVSNGRKPIGCAQFYASLGQRIRSLLNTTMLSGRAYDIDMRLRPRGDSGLLVTPINSYENYLSKEAWTWEHQALVRARFITGDTQAKEKYIAIRHKILTIQRDKDKLKREVREMREKMRENLDKSSTAVFYLKQGKGGIADIEFIVQYYVLAWSATYPDLTQQTDNMRLLDTLEALDLLSHRDVSTLKKAYCLFRDRAHKEALQGNKVVIAQDELQEIRDQVVSIWQAVMY